MTRWTSFAATSGSRTVELLQLVRRRPTRGGHNRYGWRDRPSWIHPDAHSSLPDVVPLELLTTVPCWRGCASASGRSGRARRSHAGRRGQARRRGADSLGGRRALTMETVHGTNAVFEALGPTGLRAVVGKCLMDVRGEAPARLHQSWREGLDESVAIAKRWHGASDGRLLSALAPRFAISCSRNSWRPRRLSGEHGWLMHARVGTA